MLKFKCDRCGKEIARDEAWAIVLAPGAYAAEGSKKRTQGEICGDCAEIILKEMIYLDEVPARDCHVASLLAMTEVEVPARDCHVASLLAMTEVEVHARDCHGAERLAMTEGEVPARDCHGAERLAMTEGEVPARAADSRPYEEKKTARAEMHEGMYIKVARNRAGLTIGQLAKKLYVSTSTIKGWEGGRTKKLPWDEIEQVLPEIREIRENGCEMYCPTPKACLGGGKCYYSGKKV